ncbi:MAG: maleylacetoacetate isomerase [Chromatiales bacterium]|jgi:maleylacetoacetate isomerase|nr:MAG: maleylacetoacetate isomerase [Chromatiales bacterium]
MKLYTFFRSSAAYRVRIALNLKRLPYDSVPIHFRRNGGEHRQPEFLQLNPQGLLPVLEVDGHALTQSLAIIEYLDSIYPQVPLIPKQPVPRAQVQALAQIIACDIHPINNLRVLNYLKTEIAVADDAVTAWVRHWISLGFESFENIINNIGAGKYSVGDNISLADVCLIPQVYNAERFGCDLSSYPRLVTIYERLAEHPAFLAASPERQADAE